MNESLFTSSPSRRSLQRWPLWAVALLGAMVLVPAAASGKEPKGSKRRPPPAAAVPEDSEARSKELLKKHFPLEEDIGPLPVVRVPKAPEGKSPAAAKIEKPKPPEPKPEPKETPPAAVARPAAVPAPPPIEKPPVAAAPKKKEEARPETVQAPALGSEASQQIDDLLSRALTENDVPAAAPAEEAPIRAPLDITAIKETMQAVQPEVKRSCRLGRLGVVLVRVVVTPNGEVARVTPEGKFARTPIGPCVVDRVKRARFPMSAGGSFDYTLTVR